MHVFGAMLDGEAAATELLGELLARAVAEPTSVSLRQLPFRDAKRRLADDGPGEEPAPAAPRLRQVRVLPATAAEPTIAALVGHLAADRPAGQARVLDFSPWGGAYNRVPEEATASRTAPNGSCSSTTSRRPRRDNGDARTPGLAGALVGDRPPARSGRVYPNFPDPELDDSPAAYHAANHARLAGIKAGYDPDDVFSGHQSVAARLP